jgi:hypothetical protein
MSMIIIIDVNYILNLIIKGRKGQKCGLIAQLWSSRGVEIIKIGIFHQPIKVQHVLTISFHFLGRNARIKR